MQTWLDERLRKYLAIYYHIKFNFWSQFMFVYFEFFIKPNSLEMEMRI